MQTLDADKEYIEDERMVELIYRKDTPGVLRGAFRIYLAICDCKFSIVFASDKLLQVTSPYRTGIINRRKRSQALVISKGCRRSITLLKLS